MTHSDDKGLVLPPKIAENKIVIIPILFDKTKEKVLRKAREIKKSLNKFNPILDDSLEYTPGWKYSNYELKGIPLRIEIGPKDLEKNQVVIVRRDTSEKRNIKIPNLSKEISNLLKNMQSNLYKKALKELDSKIVKVDNWRDFQKAIKERKLVKIIWCNETSCEDNIKEKTGGATSRCIPLNSKKVFGKCPVCGKPAKVEIYFSKSY